MLRSKIHRAAITDANLNYEGSLTVDAELLKAADMIPGEKVQVVNIASGSRIETYLIEGEAGQGEICLNGAAARTGQAGDRVIILTYAPMDDADAREHEPVVVIVDEKNRIKAAKA